MRKRSLRSRGPFVLYVSSFNRRKNHDFLVNVWRELYETQPEFSSSGIRLLLLGEVQGESKYSDASYKRTVGAWNIEIISDVNDARLGEYFEECLFTVYPSLQEGWGLPVQESLAYGKICLVSDTIPVAQEIDNSALIKISPLDFYAWFEAIKTWINNPRMRSVYEEHAIQYCPPSWTDISKKILSA
jgi:glycosyltransferase involved in cell wall biosynthesis